MTGHDPTGRLFTRAYCGDDWLDLCAVHDAARPQEVAAVTADSL